MKMIPCNRGTSLIEMLIYVAIVSVLLTGIGTVSMSVMDAKSKAKAVTDVYVASTDVISRVEGLLARGQSVISPGILSSSSTLITVSSATGTPKESIFLDGGVVYHATGTSSPIAVTPLEVRILNMTFTAVGGNSTTTGVRFSFALSASTTGVWKTMQYSDSFNGTAVLGTLR